MCNAADIENHLVGPFFEETPAEQSDHRLSVLPPESASVNAGKKPAQRTPASTIND